MKLSVFVRRPGRVIVQPGSYRLHLLKRVGLVAHVPGTCGTVCLFWVYACMCSYLIVECATGVCVYHAQGILDKFCVHFDWPILFGSVYGSVHYLQYKPCASTI